MKKKIRERLFNLLKGGIRCVIDGKVGYDEWIYCTSQVPIGKFLKVDYDEHAYDWCDLRVFDPLYDLAGAIFQYNLNEREEKFLVENFIKKFPLNFDNGVINRLFLYKILYVSFLAESLRVALNNKYTVGALPPSSPKEEVLQEKALKRCHTFLTNTTNTHLGYPTKRKFVSKEPIALFSIDIDGILESERLGFSATSKSAIEAFLMLKEVGLLPILNSGRSLKEVVSRCEAFSIPYGIAEYGSVIWNASKKQKTIIPNKEQLLERQRVLRYILKEKNIIVDPDFICGLRITNRPGRKFPLTEERLQKKFEALNLTRLKVIQAQGKTDIGFEGIDKGYTLKIMINKYLGKISIPIYSMGDSLSDLTMFKVSKIAYAPSNLSEDLKKVLVKQDNIIITPYPLQLGFLWATKDIIKRSSIKLEKKNILFDDLSIILSQHENIHKIKRYLKFTDSPIHH
ncbi:MAG: HAD hydrolase family protein [bacterium]